MKFFEFFDADRSGSLELDEMYLMAKQLGIPHDSMTNMIRDIAGSKGIINKNDWILYIRQLSSLKKD